VWRLPEFGVVLGHPKRIKETLQAIIDVAIRAENRAGRIVSVPVDAKLAFHISDPDYQGNEFDSSAREAVEEVLCSLNWPGYVVEKLVTLLRFVELNRFQPFEPRITLPVVSELLMECFPDRVLVYSTFPDALPPASAPRYLSVNSMDPLSGSDHRDCTPLRRCEGLKNLRHQRSQLLDGVTARNQDDDSNVEV
jgi:hypothetical protein